MTMNLEELYSLRNTFVVIGITGRTGSGCSGIAQILSKSKEDFLDLLPEPKPRPEARTNDELKDRIVYDYVKEHWKPFQIIEYKDILLLLMLEYKFDTIKFFIERQFSAPRTQLMMWDESAYDASYLNPIKRDFDYWHKRRLAGKSRVSRLSSMKSSSDLKILYDLFFDSEFREFSKRFNSLLANHGGIHRIKVFQSIANTFREKGSLQGRTISSKNVYTIAEAINKVIKAHRDHSPNSNGKVQFVVDSLRNSMEILFFKERYSSYYTFSVSLGSLSRRTQINERYGHDARKVRQLDDMEYKSKTGKFFEQDVSNCIQKGDVHVHNTIAETRLKGTPNAQEVFKSIAKYFSLIHHPGLITPSPQERCMQFAFTSKYNSGCISRQVGAVVTDGSFSIKAVGWNNTPEGQTPCLLRDARDLMSLHDKAVKLKKGEYQVYSDYEMRNPKFKKEFNSHFKNLDQSNLKGLSCPFCFKSVQNSLDEGKNQVHTRSLHAEENAFLQITKYGGTSIKGGILFTTASPCELCSKKAFQLGITKVYYIDPYPGIATNQIFKVGVQGPEMHLFVGAIGKAYHKLYEPFMAFKDELSLRTGIKILDKKSKLEKQLSELTKKNESLEEMVSEGENLKQVLRQISEDYEIELDKEYDIHLDDE